MALVGPTASGKTEVAIRLARHHAAEVLSVDSMQVYRGMDIGTAKPSILEREGVVHHMIDIVEPEAQFSVAEFRAEARRIIDDRETPIVIAGGSGLHFRAVVDPLSFAPTDSALRLQLEELEPGLLRSELLRADPEASDHVDLENPRRLVRAIEILRLTGETPTQRANSEEARRVRRYESEVEFTAVGLDPGERLSDRVSDRVGAMRSGGLLEEVGGLASRLGRTASAAVGYRELLPVLSGEQEVDEAFEAVGRNTMRLAKKQRTWFQRDPRIRWIPWHDEPGDRVQRVIEALG
jgi:tRNA dimethylallyltransferase